MSTPSPKSVLFAVVLGCCAQAAPVLGRGAGSVQKIDDSVISGDVIAFDGTVVTIGGKDAKDASPTTRLSIEDVVQIRLPPPAPSTAPSTSPTTRASTQPQPQPPRRGQQQQSDSGFVGLLRMVGLAPAAQEEQSSDDDDDGPPRPPRRAKPVTAPSTQPAPLSPVWVVKLSNRDALHAKVTNWSDQRLTVSLDPGGVSLSIPNNRITELWHAAPDEVRRAKALKTTATGNPSAEDVAYVRKDNDLVAVSGIAQGIDGESLVFRYDGQDRKIALNRLLGVVLVPQRQGPSSPSAEVAAFHQAFRFASGDLLSGRWTGFQDGAVQLTTWWDEKLTLSPGTIGTIECRNGRVVYLSDLKPARVEQSPYFDRVVPWRTDTTLGGAPITVGGVTYAKGIAMHSRCVLEYDLGGRFQRFRAKFAFEQPAGANGRAAVRVLTDDKAQFENADARGSASPEDLDVNVEGARRLVLEVDFGADQDVADRVVFANARLVRAEVGK
jgi:hypothetical protein